MAELGTAPLQVIVSENTYLLFYFVIRLQMEVTASCNSFHFLSVKKLFVAGEAKKKKEKHRPFPHPPNPRWLDSPAPDAPVRNNRKVISDRHTDNLNAKKEEIKSLLLFTMIVAELVAVPCELVATALYSAVSLTAHLGRKNTPPSAFQG